MQEGRVEEEAEMEVVEEEVMMMKEESTCCSPPPPWRMTLQEAVECRTPPSPPSTAPHTHTG